MIGFKDAEMNILMYYEYCVNFKKLEEERTCFLLPFSANML